MTMMGDQAGLIYSMYYCVHTQIHKYHNTPLMVHFPPVYLSSWFTGEIPRMKLDLMKK